MLILSFTHQRVHEPTAGKWGRNVSFHRGIQSGNLSCRLFAAKMRLLRDCPAIVRFPAIVSKESIEITSVWRDEMCRKGEKQMIFAWTGDNPETPFAGLTTAYLNMLRTGIATTTDMTRK